MRTWTMIKLCIALMAFCLVMPAPAIGASKKHRASRTVAVWKINSMGVADSVRKSLRKALVKALKQNRRWRYISNRTVLKRLKKARVSKSAPDSKVAKASRLSFMLIGTLAGIGKEISLDLKVLSGKDGKLLRRQSVVLPQNPKALAKALDELITRLLSPEKWHGSLALVVSEDGAKVSLDGKEIATTPLTKPILGINPGKHILTIRKEGFGDFSQFVVIRYHQLAKLEIDLSSATLVGLIYEKRSEEDKKKKAKNEAEAARRKHAQELAKSRTANARSGWQTITAWACLGVGAATLISSGLLAWHSSELEQDISRGWWTEGNENILKSKLKAGRSTNDWSNYTLIAGGSFVLLSAGFFLWGYLSEPDANLDSKHDIQSSASLAPLAFPYGAGLSLSGRF